MEKCPYCGKVVQADAVKCSCGYFFDKKAYENTQSVKNRKSSAAVKNAGKKNILYGAIWCMGGIIVTALTYQAAADNPTGGKYVVAWGAIVFGAIQLIRGLMQSGRGN